MEEFVLKHLLESPPVLVVPLKDAGAPTHAYDMLDDSLVVKIVYLGLGLGIKWYAKQCTTAPALYEYVIYTTTAFTNWSALGAGSV